MKTKKSCSTAYSQNYSSSDLPKYTILSNVSVFMYDIQLPSLVVMKIKCLNEI